MGFGVRRLLLLASLTLGGGELVIVTGANAKHFWTLLNLLNSIEAHEPGAAVVTYDLGLSEEQRQTLVHTYRRHTHRRFPFEDYPAHFDMSRGAGAYAWKPVIVAACLEEFGPRAGVDAVLWLDAGCALRRPLEAFRESVRQHGFHSPRSPGTVERWTHPATLAHFAVGGTLAAPPAAGAGREPAPVLPPNARVRQYRMLSAGILGLDHARGGVRELVAAWAACALERDCIAPDGSSRENHRQDQSALSILAARFGYTEAVDIRHPGYELKHQQGKHIDDGGVDVGECI